MNLLLIVLRKASLIFLVLLGLMMGLPRLLLKSFLVFVSVVLTVAFAIFLVEVLWVSPREYRLPLCRAWFDQRSQCLRLATE